MRIRRGGGGRGRGWSELYINQRSLLSHSCFDGLATVVVSAANILQNGTVFWFVCSEYWADCDRCRWFLVFAEFASTRSTLQELAPTISEAGNIRVLFTVSAYIHVSSITVWGKAVFALSSYSQGPNRSAFTHRTFASSWWDMHNGLAFLTIGWKFLH